MNSESAARRRNFLTIYRAPAIIKQRSQNQPVAGGHRCLHLRPRMVSVVQIVQAALQGIALRKPQANLNLENTSPYLAVQADQKYLVQAVYSLLNQAVEVTGAGDQITLRAERCANKMICIGIDHSGCGLTPRQRTRLAAPSGARDFHDQATLGLLFAKQVAVAHGGDLGMHVAEAFGTRFYLWLDRAHD